MVNMIGAAQGIAQKALSRPEPMPESETLNEPVVAVPAAEPAPEPPAPVPMSDADWAAADAGALNVQTAEEKTAELKAEEPALEETALAKEAVAATTTTTDPAKSAFEARQAIDQVEANRRAQTVAWANEQLGKAADTEAATGHRPNDRDDKEFVGQYMDAPARQRNQAKQAGEETEDWCAHFVSTALQATFEEKWGDIGFRGGLHDEDPSYVSDGRMIRVQDIDEFAKQAEQNPTGPSWKHLSAESVRAGGETPRPGDIVIFENQSHTGIVTEWHDDGTFKTVEGNRNPQNDPQDVLPESVYAFDYNLKENVPGQRQVLGFAVPPYRAVG